MIFIHIQITDQNKENITLNIEAQFFLQTNHVLWNVPAFWKTLNHAGIQHVQGMAELKHIWKHEGKRQLERHKHKKETLGTCELADNTVKQQVSLDSSDKPSGQLMHRILSVTE
jgi:hypothetical protein